MSAFGLLPSPPISDSRPASAGADSSSYFECKSHTNSDEDTPTQELSEEPSTERLDESIEEPAKDPVEAPVPEAVHETIQDTLDEPLEELMKEPEKGPPGEPTLPFEKEEKIHYRAYRPPGWTRAVEERRRTDVTNVREAHSNLIRQCEAVSQNQEKPSTVSPVLGAKSSIASPSSVHSPKPVVPGTSPRPQRPRTATVSSEASWVPTNFSYCQTWLQGVPCEAGEDKDEAPKEFNRRKFQIVETDPPMPKLDIIPGAKALEEPVVSSSAWFGSQANHAHVQLQRFAVASKPKLVEVTRQSSPSMTPSTASPMPPPPSLLPHPLPMTPDQRQEEVSAFSPDTPLDMSDSGYGTRESGYSMDSYQDSKDDDTYTDPGSLTSDSVTSTVVCERPDSAQGVRDRSPQPEIRSGSVSPKASSSPRTASSGHTSNPSEKEDEKQRLLDQEWTLDDHEWTLGELDHSVKDFPRHMLRLTSPVIVYLRRNDEKVLLRPFRTIFPQVTENLLDGLCAALIARNYLVSLSTNHRRKPSISSRNDTYTVDAIPAKAYSTLGIQIPTGSPGRMKDRALGARSMDLRRQVEGIIDNLLFAICGRADDTLKSAVEVLAQVLETNVHH